MTPFETSILSVGERSGSSATVLDRLADFLEQEQNIRERIRTAMMYPLVVLGLAIVVAGVMLGVMLPNFRELLNEIGHKELPGLTRAVLAVGGFLTRWGWLLFLGLGLSIWTLFRRIRSNEAWKVAANRCLFRLPVIGQAMMSLVNLRFARSLALLTRGGVPITEGLNLAAEATGSPWIVQEMTREVVAVREGGTVGDAVSRIPPLAGSLPGWIRAGEASGDMVNLLENASERFERNWEKTVTRSLNLLEPVMILLVGVFVLIMALAILLPILSLNSSMQSP